MTGRIRRRVRDDDAGFTLVELLVAVTLFAFMSTTLLMTVISTSKAGEVNRISNDLNEEARVVLNRMSRELREAQRITAVTNPGGLGFNPAADRSITFEVDFNGNGTIEPNAADPEQLTYIYDVANQRLMVQAAGATLPVLAGNVSEFKLTFRGRSTNTRLKYDGTSPSAGACGTPNALPADGLIDWEEFDAYPDHSAGNCNGVLDVELNYIDSVTIDLSVLYGTKKQVYQTQVDLRNKTLN